MCMCVGECARGSVCVCVSVWVNVRACGWVGECERECGSVTLGECVCMSVCVGECERECEFG